MKKNCCFKIAIMVIGCAIFYNAHAALKMRGHTSAIRVGSGANFVLDQGISSFKGTLIKENGATISGQNITFAAGVLEDNGNEALLTAVLNSSNQLLLSGNQTLRAQPGKILQSLLVSGTGNRLEGLPLFNSAITLTDSSTQLTLALQSTLNQSIALGGGTVLLDNRLEFVDTKYFTGQGTVDVQGNEVVFGGQDFAFTSSIIWVDAGHITLNATVNLSGRQTFSGENHINGNGNIIDLSSGGILAVANNSTLCLSDVTIKGLTNSKIILSNAQSKICLNNVSIELDGNITTTIGTIQVDAPSTFILKDYNWTFDTNALLIVDGVTLWKDAAGQTTFGEILFGNPEEYYLSLLNDGAIKRLQDDDILQSSIDTLSNQVVDNGNGIMNLQNMVDMLKTSTGALQNELDAAELVIDALETSTASLQGQIDSNDTDISNLQSQISDNDADIESLQSMVDMIKTSTGALQDELDAAELVIDVLETSTASLQVQINSNDTDISNLQSQISDNDADIESLQSMVDMIKTSTGALQAEIDAAEVVIDALETSTASLQAQIDSNDTDISNLQSQISDNDADIESLQSMVDMVKTSTGQIQAELDVLDNIPSLVDELKSCCDEVKDSLERIDDLEVTTSLLETSTASLQAQIDSNDTDISNLQSQISDNDADIESLQSMVDMVKTSTGVLQAELDGVEFVIDVLETSTASLQVQIDSNDTDISSLQSQISDNDADIESLQSMVDMIKTSTGALQVELDGIEFIVDVLETSTASLQLQVDSNDTDISNLQSQISDNDADIESLQSMVDMIKTSTGALQVELDGIEFIVDVLETSTASLQLQVDSNDTDISSLQSQISDNDADIESLQSMVDMIKTSTGQIQAELDVLDNIPSLVDELKSCCDEVKDSLERIDDLEVITSLLETSTVNLQSQIDSNDTDISNLQLQISDNDADIESLQSMMDMVKTSTGIMQQTLDLIGYFPNQVVLTGSPAQLPPLSMLEGGFILQNNSTLATIGISWPIVGNILLNGGTLVLEKDLLLDGASQLLGGGTINAQGHSVLLSPSMTAVGPSLNTYEPFVFENAYVEIQSDLVIQDTVIFEGDTIINGNGHTFDVSNGELVIASGSTVRLQNVKLKHLKSDSLYCEDNFATLILDEVDCLFDENYSFTQGSLEILNNVRMLGDVSFIWNGDKTVTIHGCGIWQFESGMTFSYDPSIDNNSLIICADNTSSIKLYDARLHVADAGLQLTKGNFIVEGNVALSNDGSDETEGIIFGDGSYQENDMQITILPGSSLNVESGFVIHNNVN